MKRINIAGILADPGARRTLMVAVIQATQAREGIDTTSDQAASAYDAVQHEKQARPPKIAAPEPAPTWRERYTRAEITGIKEGR